MESLLYLIRYNHYPHCEKRMSGSGDTLKDVLGDLRIFFYGGIRSLPLTIAGTMLIMSLCTANYAMLFFLVGFMVVTPLLATLLNLAGSMMDSSTYARYIGFSSADTCRVSIPVSTNAKNAATRPSVDELLLVSPWLGMMFFFIGYLFTNALQLYNREPIQNAINVSKDPLPAGEGTESGSSRRRMQSVISLICIVLFAVYVLYSRLGTSGCESWVTAMITVVLFGYGGHGWFKLLSTIGQDRLSDLFGIANRLLSPGAIANQPIACVEVPN